MAKAAMMQPTYGIHGMKHESANILLAKLYTALAHHSHTTSGVHGGIYVDYDTLTHELKVNIDGGGHDWQVLVVTDDPDSWATDGRKNWRAIKALVERENSDHHDVMDGWVNEELLGADPTDEELREELLSQHRGDWLHIAEYVRPELMPVYERLLAINESIPDADWEAEEERRRQEQIEQAERIRLYRERAGLD